MINRSSRCSPYYHVVVSTFPTLVLPFEIPFLQLNVQKRAKRFVK